MRTSALLIALICSCTAFSQVAFNIVEPASIAGGYDFTSNGDAPNWGLANLNNPADAVTDTVVVAEDGTPGINAQGIPHSNEACFPLTNNVAGKIVMVYRYDGQSTNDCWAGTKVLNAENAGAVGVIIVNRDDNLFGYDGTTDGPATTIPFAFITRTDGELIRSKIDAGDDVVAFIGNKLGLFNDDLGIKKVNTMIPREACTPALTSLDATEFGFDIGTRIYNYGSNTQNNIMLTAEVTGPAGTWTETAGPYTLAMGDSIDVYTGGANNINAFSFNSYPTGNYVLNYTVDLGSPDEMDFDNELNYTFVVSDQVFSYAPMDTVSGLPDPSDWTRSTGSQYISCINYDNANASRLAATGVYMAATPAWDATFSIDGEFVTAILYSWDDNFVDLNDANFDMSALTFLTEGEYIFDASEDSAMVYIPFDTPTALMDDQRYLACVQVWNDNLWIGHNRSVNYNMNLETYAQPMVPLSADGSWFALGFGTDITPAIGLRIMDEGALNIQEDQVLSVHIFANPTNSELSISVKDLEYGEVNIFDLSGKLVKKEILNSSFETIDVSELEAGQYILSISDQNQHHTQKRFTKI